VDVTVIIPTFDRPQKLAACVGALSKQSLEPGRYEVLVGIDGPDTGNQTTDAARRAWTLDQALLSITPLARRGQAAVRNALLPQARGRTLVFLNDDMIPTRDLLAAHHVEQERQRRAGTSALVIGSAPWVIHHPDRLFDRLVRETSMVFFYNQMDKATRAQSTVLAHADPPLPSGRGEQTSPSFTGSADSVRDRDWGFRHAWLLNLSADAAQVKTAGGFSVFPCTYGYEDDELAFRMGAKFGTKVLYRPEAGAHHDHRLDPASYLEREYKLGYAAWGFAGAAPECARVMFNRDIRDQSEIGYCRDVVRRERIAAQRALEAFDALAELPGSAVTGEHAPRLIELVYQQHLPLKRYTWRRGLLDAAEGREMNPDLQK